MDFELLERRRMGKSIPRKKTLSHEIKKSIYLLISALLSLIVILSIVFLLNTSQSSQKGYVLQQEQIKKEQLIIQNHDLVNKIIEAMTYKRIEESPLIKAMAKPENPQYLKEEKKP